MNLVNEDLIVNLGVNLLCFRDVVLEELEHVAVIRALKTTILHCSIAHNAHTLSFTYLSRRNETKA